MNINELIEQIGGRGRLEKIASWSDVYGRDANVMLPASEAEAMASALLAVLDAQEKPSIEVEKMNVERQALIFWLKNEINLIESARDEIPFGLDADGEMALKEIRTALSALEAKPVCYTGSGSMEAVKVGCEGYIWRDCENSHPIGLYTAPPVASVHLQITDEMALAFHQAIGDGSIGSADVAEIKTGLASAFANVTFPPAASAPKWSNAQCMEFLTVAFRHCDISGDIEMDDIRLGVKMANAAAPVPGGDGG